MKLSGVVEDIDVAVELRDFQEAQKLTDKRQEIEKEIFDIRAEKIEKKNLQPSERDVTTEESLPADTDSFTQDSASKVCFIKITDSE